MNPTTAVARINGVALHAAGELPEGFNYRITADQYDSTHALLSSTISALLSSPYGEYGHYIQLDAGTTEIAIHYTIVSDVQWGVFKYWSSLVDTLA